jgi:hypothetical protein
MLAGLAAALLMLLCLLLFCRRLTPNFKVRVEVSYKSRCSFPLTLKAYVISQQEKDSVPEWVPDDFLDPDLPQVCILLLYCELCYL